MSVVSRKSSIVLLSALAVVAAIGLGACSRSQSVSDSLMGPQHRGAGSFQGGLPNAALSSVSLAPASVAGGGSSAGTVTLSGAAPSGGLVIKLASSRAGVSVPGQITVAAGSTSGGFTVTTATVTATATATITATLGGVNATATLTVTAGGVAPPPPVNVSPCVSLAGKSATVVNATASIPQFRVARLRADITGDTPAGTINTLGGCAPVAAPAVSFISGTGNLTRGGGSVTATGAALTFGPLLFPGLALEPGVVIATDGGGNVLEIVWPALTGLPAGPPILRLQLAQFRNVATGDVLNATMTFVGRAPDGSTATFSASATGLVVPFLQ